MAPAFDVQELNQFSMKMKSSMAVRNKRLVEALQNIIAQLALA